MATPRKRTMQILRAHHGRLGFTPHSLSKRGSENRKTAAKAVKHQRKFYGK